MVAVRMLFNDGMSNAMIVRPRSPTVCKNDHETERRGQGLRGLIEPTGKKKKSNAEFNSRQSYAVLLCPRCAWHGVKSAHGKWSSWAVLLLCVALCSVRCNSFLDPAHNIWYLVRILWRTEWISVCLRVRWWLLAVSMYGVCITKLTTSINFITSFVLLSCFLLLSGEMVAYVIVSAISHFLMWEFYKGSCDVQILWLFQSLHAGIVLQCIMLLSYTVHCLHTDDDDVIGCLVLRVIFLFVRNGSVY
jgi:hypothetical protein